MNLVQKPAYVSLGLALHIKYALWNALGCTSDIDPILGTLRQHVERIVSV